MIISFFPESICACMLLKACVLGLLAANLGVHQVGRHCVIVLTCSVGASVDVDQVSCGSEGLASGWNCSR